jgi:hypothetical protein
VLCVAATPVSAQRVLGPWEDATIAPRGMIRTAIGVHFGHWTDRFARIGNRSESLGADLTRDSLGPTILPGMGGLAAGLDALLGPGSALSLGSVRTRLEVTESRVPIGMELGLTRRIGVQVLVPYVKNHVHVTAQANPPGGAGATLGLNPGRTFPGARTQNEAVVASIGSAATLLTNELQRCLGSTDPSCAAINADRQAAADLVQRAAQAADAIASIYGTTTAPGSLYAPLAGGVLQQAVDAQLAQLGDAFASFLGPPQAGTWIGSRPVAAPLLAAAELDSLLGAPAFGISARLLSDYEHSHLGDVEVGAKVLLLDTFGDATAPAPPRLGALRLAVAGIYRLPTGQLDLPDDFTDVGTGDRQADLEVRGFADFALGTGLWASAVLRYAVQRPDRLVRRVPGEVDDPFPEAVRRQEVSRDLGDVTEFEVAPRFLPNDAFAFSALYRYRTKGTDRYTGTFDVTSVDGTPLAVDASVLGIGTAQSEQVLGLAATFSTLRGYALRESRWPLEISLVHTTVLAGSGGVARRSSTGVVLRLYRRMRGADPLRPPATVR